MFECFGRRRQIRSNITIDFYHNQSDVTMGMVYILKGAFITIDLLYTLKGSLYNNKFVS